LTKEFKAQAYTIIYWLIQEGKLDPDQLFDLLELYWPTFIEKDGYIFLKEQYSAMAAKSSWILNDPFHKTFS